VSRWLAPRARLWYPRIEGCRGSVNSSRCRLRLDPSPEVP
jgi:hypothetical protein